MTTFLKSPLFLRAAGALSITVAVAVLFGFASCAHRRANPTADPYFSSSKSSARPLPYPDFPELNQPTPTPVRIDPYLSSSKSILPPNPDFSHSPSPTLKSSFTPKPAVAPIDPYISSSKSGLPAGPGKFLRPFEQTPFPSPTPAPTPSPAPRDTSSDKR